MSWTFSSQPFSQNGSNHVIMQKGSDLAAVYTSIYWPYYLQDFIFMNFVKVYPANQYFHSCAYQHDAVYLYTQLVHLRCVYN